MNRLLYLRNVASLRLDETKCVGCGMCLHVCPHGVLEKDNGAVRIAELDACMECGACVKNCPHEALYVKVGVGCATAVLNAALGRTSACCCIVEDEAEESKSARCC